MYYLMLNQTYFWLTLLLHRLQEKSLSSACTCWCRLRSFIWEKTLVTLTTGKWLLFRVYSLMYNKVTSLRKTLITLTKRKWLLSSVYSLMLVKNLSSKKLFVTQTTIRSSVYSLLLVKNLSSKKLFVTQTTRKSETLYHYSCMS